jgi:hypothetical protein
MKMLDIQLATVIIINFGIGACSVPTPLTAERMNEKLHILTESESLEDFRSPLFIEDLGYIPTSTARPEDLYLRVFGRFDNLERLFKEAPERVTKTKDSVMVTGDGGILVNEKLTLLGPSRFRLEKDRGGNARLYEVYNYNGEGWLLESWSIQ